MSLVVSKRLVIATHNPGKLSEFKNLLGPYVSEIISSGELGLPAPEETGTTFKENALLKAKAAALASGSAALGDDSGLCIHALGGRPGIYSARWTDRGMDEAFRLIQEELGSTLDRSAHFTCVLALCAPDGTCEFVEGRVDGTLARTPRGTQGHGYDPLFIPDGYAETFAEMDAPVKNSLSHRGRASKAFIERFFATQKRA